jgi:hypothetical protein
MTRNAAADYVDAVETIRAGGDVNDVGECNAHGPNERKANPFFCIWRNRKPKWRISIQSYKPI